MRTALPPFALALAAACGSGPSGTALVAPVDDGLPASCSPLRVPGACMMPWPNAIYLDKNASTATGWQVALDGATLPVGAKPFDPTRWNMADGFSPSGPMLTWFAESIDPKSLVPETDIAASLRPGAATVVVDMDSKQLVAHFSGVDEDATRTGARQAIVITPAQRLLAGHRYAVAITKAIRTTSGGLPTRPPLFQPMLHGQAPSDPLSQKQLALMPAIVSSLAAAGVPQDQLLVAWCFVTASDSYITGNVLSMRDQGLAAVGPDGAGYTITSTDENLDAQTLRRIRGTFTVPQFIDNADESKPEAQLELDSTGKPKLLGTYQAPFTVIVPAVAAKSAPLPIIVYGHGLFGTGEGELGDAMGSYVQDFANEEGYVVVATDWIGLSGHESPASAVTPNNGAVGDMLTDFSELPWITDRLQQALVNAMVLERTMVGRIVKDPAMTVTGKAGGAPVADPSRVHYYGISLGGIMGMSFMGYDPDVTEGVLGVGAGFWSTLFQRSVNWKLAQAILPGSYPDALDVQLLLALAQMQFDFSDPANVAPHVLSAPLRGVPPKHILAQMGLYDAQVPNVASEMIARTAGLPLLQPAVVVPWNLKPQAGPLSSALTTWDVHGNPAPPDTDQTPALDNQVHEAVRRIPQAEQQIQTFYETGQVVDTCDGSPCAEPVPPGTPDAGL